MTKVYFKKRKPTWYINNKRYLVHNKRVYRVDRSGKLWHTKYRRLKDVR